MKKLLLPILLCTSTLLFAQSKDESFIKKLLYVKISPALYAFIDEADNLESEGFSPAVFVAVGAKMRYAAVGFSTGRFKLRNAGTITPTGIDLTVTDFKSKVSPVFTAQWHQTHFKENYQSGRYSSTYVEGKNMYTIGAGGAFTTLKSSKIMLTAGVSKMDCKITRISIAGGPTQPTAYYYSKGHYKMLFIAVSFVW
jgi:hypothetical protein